MGRGVKRRVEAEREEEGEGREVVSSLCELREQLSTEIRGLRGGNPPLR